MLIIRSDWILPEVDVQYVFLFTFDLPDLRVTSRSILCSAAGARCPVNLAMMATQF
jgi:hypothetical protein